MEMVLKNGFCEISRSELMNIDGGSGPSIVEGILLGFIGIDLANCYNRGRAEVLLKYSVSGGDAE